MTLADYGLARDALRAEVQIDTDAEYMLGDDQAYNCYPTRFATVEFQLVDTLELSQIADTIRKAKGFSPMLEDGGDMEGWYDFSLGLNSYTETSLDTGIRFAVVNTESPDNEGYYIIDLSEEEQRLIYNALDDQCRRYYEESYADLLEEARQAMEGDDAWSNIRIRENTNHENHQERRQRSAL